MHCFLYNRDLRQERVNEALDILLLIFQSRFVLLSLLSDDLLPKEDYVVA